MSEPTAPPRPHAARGVDEIDRRPIVFVTGATGYIGGRLVPRLLERGYRVRCLVRDARKLDRRPWIDAEGLEVLEGDVADEGRTAMQMRGCATAYYLVHSMVAAGKDYRNQDRTLATRFAAAARAAGVRRIVYLGGLGETGDHLSEHLRSRREVEEALRSGGVPVTVLRAAMIIGSGSASFEILRYLVDRLPVMITPRWVLTRSQPIAVRDVLHYLVACLEVEETTGRVLDIGGSEIVTYRELMRIMAELRGLGRRFVLPVPILTPRLSSYWIHLVTPIDHRIARPLAEGLRNEVICRDAEAQRLMPHEETSIREAIERALAQTAADARESTWMDAGVMPGDPDWAGGDSFEDARVAEVRAKAPETFEAVCRVGGGHGYYAADFLWRVRGALDRLFGGPGLRRGRTHEKELRYGDALDFWRVKEIIPNRRLALRAEMKLPGEALLRFDIEEQEDGRSMLRQTARFLPRGLLGLLYWYAVAPLHHIVFRGMLAGIQRAAESAEAEAGERAVEPRAGAIRRKPGRAP